MPTSENLTALKSKPQLDNTANSIISEQVWGHDLGVSRHRVTSASCPLFPSKRTFISAVCMSAKCQKQKL